MFDIGVSLLAMTAVFAYFNHKYIGLPTVIGVMSIALVLSVALFGLSAMGFGGLHDYEASMLESIDFSEVLLQGMLSILLFAGALHVDFSELKSYRWQVGMLAVGGTLVSTALVGLLLWLILPLTGIALPLPFCLLFGALISPTDPIAVLGIMRSAGAPPSLEIVISGEALFNDGVGVALFSLMLSMIAGGELPSMAQSASLLLREAGGGLLFGCVLGYVTYCMIKSIDSYQEEVLITLAAVLAGYALANRLRISGPLAMVVAGLIIGNHGRKEAMSNRTRDYIDKFWELLDTILNSMLFVLIGLEVTLIFYSSRLILAIIATIAVTLGVRLLVVTAPIGLFHRALRLPQGTWQMLSWGGLRGGISVALALSVQPGPARDIVVSLTYAVVVFSILVQGLTIGLVVKKVAPCAS